MSLVEHIQELRRRIIISLLVLFAGTIVGYIWYQRSVLGIPTLGDLLRGPYCDLPPDKRVQVTASGECRLLATSPFEMFMLRLKVGALAGSVLTAPLWLGQIWGFINPGLLKNERRWTLGFLTIATTLFVMGAVLAYFVVSVGLEFLMTIGDNTSVAALNGEAYFHFLFTLLLLFGVSFEVPLIIGTLNIIGVLSYESIKSKRRLIIVSLFVFAAFMTPGQDPFSMVCLALALTVLVELSLQFCRYNDRRRQRERPDWLDLDDDEASGPIAPAGGVGAAGGIDAPAPVGPVDPVRPSQRPTPGGVSRVDSRLPNMQGAQERGNLAERLGSDFDDVL
ncbi:twin-arginine translocase subunit TatC [Corynebacterium sp. 13CS0277]|nr:twin-arginine translocase subunit TatC [Corynebacterium sp. 13CS0277]PRQ12114.1 twin-arginine translocase subunit TatC [Corynebacterium sp. 13CS0277]